MGNPHKLTNESVLEILEATNLVAEDTPTQDPLTKSRIRVTLDQLKPYENNPRSTRNPKFNEILLSIENAGLDQPPNISRRSPDDPYYMIIDGGNTRLEILKQLHQKYTQLASAADTEAERLALTRKADSFYLIDCIFKPWISESRAMIGHMSENENRGDMLFIEKALAVQKLREIYQEEDRESAVQAGQSCEASALSMRKLAERITAQGWTVGVSHLSRYEYAANFLLKAIPTCFWAGAGHPLVRQLRRIDTAYTQFWLGTSAGQAHPESIQELFLDTLKLYDSETIDIRAFQHELNGTLGDILDLSPTLVMLEIDAIISGSHGLKPPTDEPQQPEPANMAGDQKTSTPLCEADGAPPSDITPQGLDQPPSHLRGKPSQKQTGKAALPPSPMEHQPALPADVVRLARDLASNYGIEILPEVCASAQEQRQRGIPFGVRPIRGVFKPGTDDEAAAIWWALTKYSLSFHVTDTEEQFAQALTSMYGGYLDQKSPLGTLLHMEELIQRLRPDVMEPLITIKRLCAQHIQASHEN